MAQSFWRSFGMAATTVASRRRFKKSVMEWKTLVACQSSHPRMALTLTRICIANIRLRTRWIAIAKTTTCGHVAKSVLAIWARSSDVLVFAQALTSDRITFTWEWTILIAVACFALSWQGIAKEAVFALVTIPSSCISKTLKTFSSPELKYLYRLELPTKLCFRFWYVTYDHTNRPHKYFRSHYNGMAYNSLQLAEGFQSNHCRTFHNEILRNLLDRHCKCILCNQNQKILQILSISYY